MDEFDYKIVAGNDLLKYKDKPSFDEHSYKLFDKNKFTEGAYAVESEWKRNVDEDTKSEYLGVGDKLVFWSIYDDLQEVTITQIQKPAIWGTYTLDLEKEDGDSVTVNTYDIKKDMACNDSGYIFGTSFELIRPLAIKHLESKIEPFAKLLEWMKTVKVEE